MTRWIASGRQRGVAHAYVVRHDDGVDHMNWFSPCGKERRAFAQYAPRAPRCKRCLRALRRERAT